MELRWTDFLGVKEKLLRKAVNIDLYFMREENQLLHSPGIRLTVLFTTSPGRVYLVDTRQQLRTLLLYVYSDIQVGYILQIANNNNYMSHSHIKLYLNTNFIWRSNKLKLVFDIYL